MQFLVFCVIGIVNTGVDVGTYYVLTRVAWSPEYIEISKAASYLLATFGSYVMNRYVTFGKRGAITKREIIRFYSTVGLGLFVNVGVLYISVRMLGVHDLAGALASAGATAAWGFLFSKFYVFK